MKTLDAPAMLRKLTAIREEIPQAVGKRADELQRDASTMRVVNAVGATSDAVADFEEQAVVDAIESLASELRAAVDEVRVMRFMMRSKSTVPPRSFRAISARGSHPQVKAMRSAFERDLGRAISPRRIGDRVRVAAQPARERGLRAEWPHFDTNRR